MSNGTGNGLSISNTAVPAWLSSSPFFRLATVLHVDIVSRFPNPTATRAAGGGGTTSGFTSSGSPQQPLHAVRNAASPQRGGAGVGGQQQSLGDILSEPRVNAFLHYAVPLPPPAGSSVLGAAWSAPVEVKEVNFTTAPSIASVFHFLALCKASPLPAQATRALFVEGASLFVALMRAVNSTKLTFRAGVDEVGFLQFIVSSMVQLRGGGSGSDGDSGVDVGFAAVDKKLVDDALAHAFPIVLISSSGSASSAAGGEAGGGQLHRRRSSVGSQSWTHAQRQIVAAVTSGIHAAAAALLDAEDVAECHHLHRSSNVQTPTTALTCTACLHIAQSATKGRRGVTLPITPSLLGELISCAENIMEGCPKLAGRVGGDEDDEPELPLQATSSITARESIGSSSSDGGNPDDAAEHRARSAATATTAPNQASTAQLASDEDDAEFTSWSVQVLSNLMAAFSLVVLAESINSQQYSPASTRLLRIMRRLTTLSALRSAIFDATPHRARLVSLALVALYRLPNESNSITCNPKPSEANALSTSPQTPQSVVSFTSSTNFSCSWADVVDAWCSELQDLQQSAASFAAVANASQTQSGGAPSALAGGSGAPLPDLNAVAVLLCARVVHLLTQCWIGEVLDHNSTSLAWRNPSTILSRDVQRFSCRLVQQSSDITMLLAPSSFPMEALDEAAVGCMLLRPDCAADNGPSPSASSQRRPSSSKQQQQQQTPKYEPELLQEVTSKLQKVLRMNVAARGPYGVVRQTIEAAVLAAKSAAQQTSVSSSGGGGIRAGGGPGKPPQHQNGRTNGGPTPSSPASTNAATSSCATIAGILSYVFSDSVTAASPALSSASPSYQQHHSMSSSPLSLGVVDEILFTDVSRTVTMAVMHVYRSGGVNETATSASSSASQPSSICLALASMASELFLRSLAKIQQEAASMINGSISSPSSHQPPLSSNAALMSTFRSSNGSPVDQAAASFDAAGAPSGLENAISVGAAVAVTRALCTCSRSIRRQLAEEICDVLATKRNVVSMVLRQDSSNVASSSNGSGMMTRAHSDSVVLHASSAARAPPHQRTSSTSTAPVHHQSHHHSDDGTAGANHYGSPWRVASQMFCLGLLTRIAVVDDADTVDAKPLRRFPSPQNSAVGSAARNDATEEGHMVCLYLPRDLNSDSLERVLQLLCEAIDDEIRDEVHRGRILQSASSIASFATPMYVGPQLEGLVMLIARISAALERRVSTVTNFVQVELIGPLAAAQNNQPRSRWRSLVGVLEQQHKERCASFVSGDESGDDETDSNTGGDDDGDRLLQDLLHHIGGRPQLHSTKYLLAKPVLAALSATLASDSAALDRVTVSITQLSLTLGWPGTGTLFQNFRSGDVSALRSIGIVLQTLLLPFVAIVAHTQQLLVVAARCAGLVEQLSALAHTEHSFEMLRRRLSHISRWWPPASTRYGADLWLMKTATPNASVHRGNATSSNGNQGPLFSYALSEASSFPWQGDMTSMQVQRFRSFWLMIAMHNITTGPVDTIVLSHGLSKRSNGSSSTATNTNNNNSILATSSGGEKKHRNGPWAVTPASVAPLDVRCSAQSCHVRSSVANKSTNGLGDQRLQPLWCFSSSIIAYAQYAFHTLHVGGETGAAAAIAFPLRMLAACAPPLIHLRAAECQQALAEGISFERLIAATSSGGSNTTSAAVEEIRREMQASLASLCPPVASVVKSTAMTFSELALLRTIFEVAVLRASSGTTHTLVQYAQVELREFVSSKDLLDAIPICLDWAMKVYISGLTRPVSALSFTMFRCDALFVSDAVTLVQLAAIAVPSVRRMALSTLESMFTAMPFMAAEPNILSALLHTINVVQTGDEDELLNFTANLHLRHISEASSGPYDTERHTIHDALLKAARRWLQGAKDVAAHRLFDSAIRFLVEEHDEHRNLLGTAHYEGTELAIRCCLASGNEAIGATGSTASALGASWADAYSGLVSMQARSGPLALASSRLRNYANTVMRRSRATGAIDGAAAHASSIAVVERDHLRDLQRAIRKVLESLSEAPQLSERLLVKLASCQKTSPASVASSHPTPSNKITPTTTTNMKSSHVLMIRCFDTIGNVAALIEANHVSRALLPTTLRYIVQGPVQAFLPSVLHLATGAWKWILTCGAMSHRTSDIRELVANLCLALEWTVTQRLGLFDGAPHTQKVVVETGCTEQQAMAQMKPLTPENAANATAAAEGVASNNSTTTDATKYYYASDYRSNSPHKILLSFLAEQFLDRRLPIAHDPVVLRMLLRTVLFWTRDAECWSLKDASFGEYMRGVLFCLQVITAVHQANQQLTNLHQKSNHNLAKLHSSSSNGSAATTYPCTVAPFSVLITARSRVYQCLLRWLGKTPPSYYMTQESHSAVNNEHHVLEELISLIGREQDQLSQNQRGFLPIDDPLNHNDKLEAISAPSTAAVLRRKNATPPSNSPAGSGNISLQQPRTGAGASQRGPVAISETYKRLHNTLGLLKFLLKHEALRLRLWANPRSAHGSPTTTTSAGGGAAAAPLVVGDITPELWKAYCSTAASVMPEVLIAIAHRFPTNPHVSRHTSLAVTSNPAAFAHIPDAVDWYLHEGTLLAGAEHLYLWTSCSIVQALRFLGPTFKSYTHVVRYAIRSLLSADSRHLIFYLPQLLQCFTNDNSQSIERFFRAMCKKSTEFTHQLLWCLQTEGEGSGTLAGKCNLLAESIRSSMTPQQFSFYLSEFEYVNAVISVSGKLKPVEKAKRKEQLRTLLATETRAFHDPIPKSVLYLPTNPNFRITKLIPHTAGAMQSAAKCPILVQFEVIPRDPENVTTLPLDLIGGDAPSGAVGKPATSGHTAAVMKKACIFKMGDDCRQDQIALQLISYIQRILHSVNLPFFLHPYRVVTTGATSGIIECVPNAMSRDQIGKLVESNIAEHFVQTYGPPQSPAFREARLRFIQSMASYSVASYILNIKDRHNGNIMFDDKGHLIHIDFGFIFDFSPGGDMNFESSPFKLTQEMLQLMGDTVSGRQTIESSELSNALIDPESYETFVRLTVLCYLAVRQHAKDICVLVELMLSSGLPCFKPKKTIADLADRLSLNRTEVDAATFMFERVLESRDNMRTRLYDRYQNIAEGIEM